MLECKNLSWKYGDNEALSNLSCVFKEQSLTMILGPNGSGKTTLIKLLSGAFELQKGEILLDSIPLKKLPPRQLAKKIAYVAQSSKIAVSYTHLTLPTKRIV